MELEKSTLLNVKQIIGTLPKDSDFWDDLGVSPYELMIYVKTDDKGNFDLKEFADFKNINELKKVCNKIIKYYNSELYSIDFKYWHPIYDYDQITIYKH